MTTRQRVGDYYQYEMWLDHDRYVCLCTIPVSATEQEHEDASRLARDLEVHLRALPRRDEYGIDQFALATATGAERDRLAAEAEVIHKRHLDYHLKRRDR